MAQPGLRSAFSRAAKAPSSHHHVSSMKPTRPLRSGDRLELGPHEPMRDFDGPAALACRSPRKSLLHFRLAVSHPPLAGSDQLSASSSVGPLSGSSCLPSPASSSSLHQSPACVVSSHLRDNHLLGRNQLKVQLQRQAQLQLCTCSPSSRPAPVYTKAAYGSPSGLHGRTSVFLVRSVCSSPKPPYSSLHLHQVCMLSLLLDLTN